MSSTAPSDPAAAAAAEAAAAAAFRQLTIEVWTLLGIGILVTMLRTYARIRAVGIKGLQADDFLVWIGVTFYALETALAYSVGNVAKGMANNGMTDEQRAALDPDSPEYGLRVIGSKIQIAGWSSYSVMLWSLKASLLVFYLRLTTGLSPSYQIRVNIGFGLLIATFIALVMTIFLGCRPFHKYWQINPDPGNVCQPAQSHPVVFVCLGLNIVTDLYLLSIPVPMLWKSSLKPLKKIGLILVFSGGIFVMVCAILRSILIVIDPINGAQVAGSWGVRETFVAVVVANIPMIYPLMKNWLTTILGSVITSVRSTRKYEDRTSRELRTIGGGGGTGQSWRARGTPTAHPISNVTFNESEERMMDEFDKQNFNSWNQSPPLPRETPNNNSNSNNIQKQVEVSVVHEPAGESRPQQEDFIFDNNKTQSSSYASNAV